MSLSSILRGTKIGGRWVTTTAAVEALADDLDADAEEAEDADADADADAE